MKVVVEYQCEICNSKYSTQDQALDCEAKGVFEPANSWLVPGLMYEHHHNGFVGVFAVPIGYPRKSMYGPHWGYSSFWAIRAPGYPPYSLDEETCGGDDFLYNTEEKKTQWIKYHHIDKNLNGPEFNKMVEYLRGKGLTPRYYTKEGKLVEL